MCGCKCVFVIVSVSMLYECLCECAGVSCVIVNVDYKFTRVHLTRNSRVCAASYWSVNSPTSLGECVCV